MRRPPPAEPPAAPPSYVPITVDNGGSIAGNVRWDGPLPEVTRLEVRNHRDTCGATQPSPALRVSARRGVADAVVSLTIATGAQREVPGDAIPLVLRGCRFVPHVLAVPLHAPIGFRNEDPGAQNVHASMDDETLWDFAPPRGALLVQRADSLGAIRVVSDVHSFMHAWIHVFEHPYFATTDEAGHYRISRVPPGQYVLRVWHEGWRIVATRAGRPVYGRAIVLTRTISVSERQETAGDFELSNQLAEFAGE